jgi:hypothetical protein
MKVARAASPLSTALMFAIANDVVVPTAAINQFLKSLFTSSFFRKTSLQRNCLYATTPEIHWLFLIGTPYAPHVIQTMKKAIILAAALMASVLGSQAVTITEFSQTGTTFNLVFGTTDIPGDFYIDSNYIGYGGLRENEDSPIGYIPYFDYGTHIIRKVIDQIGFETGNWQTPGQVVGPEITFEFTLSPVPDGGATAAMLGLGVLGLMGFRRHVKAC